MKKKLLIALLIVAVIVAGLMAIRHKKRELATAPLPKRPVATVETATASFGSYPVMMRYLARIRPKVEADIAPQITGQVIEVMVREGQRVEKGGLLARLDDRKETDRVLALEAETAAARSAYETQRSIYQRDERLFQEKAISQEALERSRSARDAARARLKSLEKSLSTAKTELSYTRLVAPFSGIITKRHQDPGDLALPGRPVITMEAPKEGYFVEAMIPQEDLPRMKKGALVEIFPGSRMDDTALEARISRIHPAVGSSMLAAIEADLPSSPFGLPSGATVMVQVEAGTVTGFRVPLRALLENSSGDWIYTLDEDSRISIERVKALWKGPEFAVVETGALTDTTPVVVAQESALLRLHQGQEVRRKGGSHVER
jgi:RND family efflux transporter MFP subunit